MDSAMPLPSKTTRRKLRRECMPHSACEDLPLSHRVAELHSKLLRVEGRVGTICDKMQLHMDSFFDVHARLNDIESSTKEFAADITSLKADNSEIDLQLQELRKVFTFIDIEKLQLAIDNELFSPSSRICSVDPLLPFSDASTESTVHTPIKLQLHKVLEFDKDSTRFQDDTKEVQIFDISAADYEYDGFYDFTNATDSDVPAINLTDEMASVDVDDTLGLEKDMHPKLGFDKVSVACHRMIHLEFKCMQFGDDCVSEYVWEQAWETMQMFIAKKNKIDIAPGGKPNYAMRLKMRRVIASLKKTRFLPDSWFDEDLTRICASALKSSIRRRIYTLPLDIFDLDSTVHRWHILHRMCGYVLQHCLGTKQWLAELNWEDIHRRIAWERAVEGIYDNNDSPR